MDKPGSTIAALLDEAIEKNRKAGGTETLMIDELLQRGEASATDDEIPEAEEGDVHLINEGSARVALNLQETLAPKKATPPSIVPLSGYVHFRETDIPPRITTQKEHLAPSVAEKSVRELVGNSVIETTNVGEQISIIRSTRADTGGCLQLVGVIVDRELPLRLAFVSSAHTPKPSGASDPRYTRQLQRGIAEVVLADTMYGLRSSPFSSEKTDHVPDLIELIPKVGRELKEGYDQLLLRKEMMNSAGYEVTSTDPSRAGGVSLLTGVVGPRNIDIALMGSVDFALINRRRVVATSLDININRAASITPANANSLENLDIAIATWGYDKKEGDTLWIVSEGFLESASMGIRSVAMVIRDHLKAGLGLRDVAAATSKKARGNRDFALMGMKL